VLSTKLSAPFSTRALTPAISVVAAMSASDSRWSLSTDSSAAVTLFWMSAGAPEVSRDRLAVGPSIAPVTVSVVPAETSTEAALI